jgi:alkylation response protein AidB-like acyl-CoA dehydrogenase
VARHGQRRAGGRHRQKIFISGGDQDLTDNIVHLVLCRLPAHRRHAGLSLAWCPSSCRTAGATRWCDGIEKKMGIKGSATCQMRFEQRRGLAARRAAPRPGGDVPDDERGPAARGDAGPGPPGGRDAERLALRPGAAADARRRRPDGAQAAAADPIAWHPAMRRTC